MTSIASNLCRWKAAAICPISIDGIKQSASASRNRVFIVETQGGMSGYIATLGALAVSLLPCSFSSCFIWDKLIVGRSCTCLHTWRWYFTQTPTGRRRILASAIQLGCQGKERGSIGYQVSLSPEYLCPHTLPSLSFALQKLTRSSPSQPSRCWLSLARNWWIGESSLTLADPRNPPASTTPTS